MNNTGVKIIDDSHAAIIKEILYYLNLIDHDTSPAFVKNKMIDNSLKSISQHVNTHFEEEQEYMRSINHPEYDKHVRIHEEFRKSFAGFLANSFQYTVSEYNIKARDFIFKFLKEIENHIDEDDAKIGKL